MRTTASLGLTLCSAAVARSSPVDLFAAVGSSKTGIGPIVEDSQSATGWADWGLSLSGNGMMAEAAAAGTLRALKENGMLDHLSSISSVSGGSWFNNQFGFSQAYYHGVTDEGKTIDEWYLSYLGEAMAGMGQAASPQWEAMISAMYDGFSKGLSKRLATPQNMNGYTKADLLFCTTLNGKSLLSDNSTIVQMSTDKGPAFYSNPAFWLVPTNVPLGFHWHVPGVDLKQAEWTAGAKSMKNVLEILPTPTVGKIGAMSSAANGITSNPELSALFKPQSAYKQIFQSYLKPDNGVCTTPGLTCSFPSMMAMDGCYSDNLGFALNVGYLQKKFPGKNLRLMAVSSEMCNRTADPTCLTAVKGSAFRSLFANSPYPTVEGWLPAIVPGPDRRIFAESLTDGEALGQQTGYGGMNFVTGTFTTVKNDYFGVAAGTKVAIIILNVNGPLYLAPTGPADMKGLASVARNAHHSVSDLLSSFGAEKKLTSGEAFLYYQNTASTAATSSVVV